MRCDAIDEALRGGYLIWIVRGGYLLSFWEREWKCLEMVEMRTFCWELVTTGLDQESKRLRPALETSTLDSPSTADSGNNRDHSLQDSNRTRQARAADNEHPAQRDLATTQHVKTIPFKVLSDVFLYSIVCGGALFYPKFGGFLIPDHGKKET